MKTMGILIIGILFTLNVKCQEDQVSSQLYAQLMTEKQLDKFYYPKSLQRFYLENDFQPVWIKPQEGNGKTWQAMLMLDCVLQFGLAHADYHPDKLSYDTLHMLLEEPKKLDAHVKARFELLLTDAILNFMNHLHYGKFNPDYVSGRIDRGIEIPFLAVEELRKALTQSDFMSSVLDVQPKSAEYRDLQEYMRLAKGQYIGDCYEVPEGDVRLAAINMERMRWVPFDDEPYMHINIPSFLLKLHEPDSTYVFKITVGKPATPSPISNSSIGRITAAPDMKVPQRVFVRQLLPYAIQDPTYFEKHSYTVYDKNGSAVKVSKAKLQEIRKRSSGFSLRQSSGCGTPLGSVIFRLTNIADICLHDESDQKLFDSDLRSSSFGCIGVQNAAKLADLLLKYDDSEFQIPLLRQKIKKYVKHDYILKQAVPAKVTYFTCSFKEGQLLRYNDIYQLDRSLERKMYNIKE